MKHPISVSIKPAAAQCAELDKKIEHYRSLIARVTDQQANEALRKLIDGMGAQKAELHPEQQER
jgi:hypothetical protein